MSPAGPTSPLWHCSVSLVPLRPVARWTEADLALARRAAGVVLRGVGDPAYVDEQAGEWALHTRRRMTDAETKALLEGR